MKLKDFYTELQAKLKTLVVTGTSTKLFGDAVFLVGELPKEQIARYRGNQCFIVDARSSPQTENDSLLHQEFKIAVFSEDRTDVFGGAILLGSANKLGLLKIEEELIHQLDNLVTLDGEKATLILRGRGFKNLYSGNAPDIMRVLEYETLVTADITDPAQVDVVNYNDGGTLFWNPTDIANGDFGLNLGYLHRGLLFNPNIHYKFDREPDSGENLTNAIFMGANADFFAYFMTFNANNLSRVFAGMASGTKVTIPTIKTGNRVSSSGTFFGELLYVPKNPENMAINAKRVIPFGQGQIDFAKGSTSVFSCVFKQIGENNVIIQPLEDF